MNPLKVLFLGTPVFAKSCLESLLLNKKIQVVGVVTQPDRPQGRNLKLTPTPVKNLALESGITVYTPEKINFPTVLDDLKMLNADIAVVVAFGQILSENFLGLFRLGAVNIHTSLLPRWRGAAPIQRAIEAGDLETGVCLQRVVKALDAGDIIGHRRMSLNEEITAVELHDQLIPLACELLDVELISYANGSVQPVQQNEAYVTYAKKIDKSEELIDWNLGARVIHNKVRGFSLGPGVYTTLNGKKIKIWRSRICSQNDYNSSLTQIGQIVSRTAAGILVFTKVGLLEVLELQPESKQRIPAKSWQGDGQFGT